ncbi:MAG TPA: hypothetical protein VLE73_01455 [Candidatus Saccharimonadales bacterium]|nr:hypothetical protein [Candidatus Saccharimonadales bacterium]
MKTAQMLATRLLQGSKQNKIIALCIASAIFLGGLFLVLTNAAGFFAAVEPDNASLTANAKLVTDGNASGGKAVQFTAPAPTPPPPTPTPTPTPTPPPSGSTSCPLPAYPDASCTGVPAGTSLTIVNGNIDVTTSGTIIENKDIRGCITVSSNANAVIIRKSKITCTTNNIAIYREDNGAVSDANRLLIQDSTISCGVTNHTAISEANITVQRSNISGCENGFDMNQNVTVQDSYIHDMAEVGADPHTDGIQMAIGHISGGNVVNGSLNISIVHNTIILHGTSAVISNRGTDVNILIQDNLMAGGAYTLYCDQGATAVNYRVINNHFSRVLYNTVGAYGPWTDCQDETQVTGNVYHETGAPL